MNALNFLLLLSLSLPSIISAQGNKTASILPQKQMSQEELEQKRLQTQRERKEFEEAIEEQFKQSNDMIRKFFDDGELEKFHQNFRQMFRDFQNMQDLDDSMFGTPGTRQLFQQRFGGDAMFEKEWVDGPEKNQVSLVLKVKQVGSQPLNIKIENGILKIDGTIKQERRNAQGNVISSSVSNVNIQESLGRSDIIPEPVDMQQDKEGHLRIVFNRKGGAPKKIRKVVPSGVPGQRPHHRRKLKHDDDKTSI